MNAREIFRRILRFEKVDRLPIIAFENYEKSVIERWRGEGLPPGISPAQHLGMDSLNRVPVSFYPYPAFDPTVLHEDAEAVTSIDFMGTTVRRKRDNPTMYYGFTDYPVKDRDDWERYKERFQASSAERLPADLEAEIKRLNDSDQPVMLEFFPFFFRLGFYSMGMERFMTAFYDMPDLIHDMFRFWSEFVIESMRPIVPRVGVDIFAFTEDLAYKNGPHLSPQIYRDFFLPYQNVLVGALKKSGAGIVSLWTAGNIDAMLPMLMENGIDCILILERQAGMDPVRLRREYGRDLRLIGGIAKEALIEGKRAIDRALEHLMPLIEEGGYIPAIDDMIPPEVPFSHYRHYVEKMREIRP
jgi:hypothetical protein